MVRGAWWVEERNARLPMPPSPPRATGTRSPGAASSAMRWPSRTTRVPGGTATQQVAARAAVARLALAVAARRGPVVHGVAEPREVGHLVVGHQHDAAAAPAVAAVRPPARDLRLAAERQAAVAAVAPLHVDLRPIGEGHGPAGS